MKVFISHVHEESKLAQVLKDWIETTFAGQIEVFVSSDIEDIPAGSRWLEEIDSALVSSSLFLMLCSPVSLSRSWISFEAGCAWIKRVPLIPMCHSGLGKKELPSPISSFQALELESDGFIEDFFESLRIHFKISKVPRIDKKGMLQELRQAINNTSLSDRSTQKSEKSKAPGISDADALNKIESWMGSRPSRENKKVIRYADVDSELNLPAGTTKRLIQHAAERYNYFARRKGEETILLEKAKEPLRRNPWKVKDF
jgi:hypothetical protein